MPEHLTDWDVCVIGSGPGGSTAATCVAMKGHRVLLLEKEASPVYKIGESLLPSTIHGVCAILGVSKELEDAGFIRKLGGTFRWGRDSEPWTFSFSDSDKFQSPTAYAYQVERLKFDNILLKNAIAKGVEVRDRHRAVGVISEDGRVAGVQTVDDAGRSSSVRCKYVVDASGHSSCLARHAGERVLSPFFQNIALFAYYEGGKRLPPPRSGNIFCVAFDKGWFWYIPLSATLTSVGVVIDKDYFEPRLNGIDSEGPATERFTELLTEFISECPPVNELLSVATRVTTGPYGKTRTRKDYSYLNTKFWIPGLALVGDAACFIDPIFSSGVHLATYSALLCARSINSALKNPRCEETVFNEFERRYRREYGYFHDFALAFYDTGSDWSSYYWAAKQILNSKESRTNAFIGLVSGTASADDTFNSLSRVDAARQMLAERREVGKEQRGQTSNNGFWNELNRETRSMLVRSVSSVSEAPLFKDGLRVAADGLHWIVPSTKTRTGFRGSDRGEAGHV